MRPPAPSTAVLLAFLAMLGCSPGGPLGSGEGGASGIHTAVPEQADSGIPVESVAGGQDATDALFDPWSIHRIDLSMPQADWLDVRDNPHAKNWHEASFTWQDQHLDQVALRAFGSGSVVEGKPPLKISFDRLVEGQELLGLDVLKLDNSSQDYGFLNERFGTATLRALGLPASRTGWAEVWVNDEYAGFFVILEAIDDRFVERWFGHDDGALYGMNEHHWGQGLNPVADPMYWYQTQTAAGGDGLDIVAVADVLASGSIDQVNALMDLEQFTRISVARSVMGGIDTFSADGNNFYLYNDHGVFKLIPWDLDADLGYPWYWDQALSVDPRAPWRTSPWNYNSLTGAPYVDPVLQRAEEAGFDFDGFVEEVIWGPLAWEALVEEIEATAALIRDQVYSDVLGYGPYFDVRRADLQLFLHTRLSALAGRDVAVCEDAAEGVLRAADLAPSGSVGWGSAVIDGTGEWGPGFFVNGVHSCTGVFAHAPSALSFTVPEGYGSFSGGVGVQDWNRVYPCDDGAVFSVWQGVDLLWQSDSVEGYTDPVPFGPLVVEPGELLLKISENGSYSCDTTAWLGLELAPGG